LCKLPPFPQILDLFKFVNQSKTHQLIAVSRKITVQKGLISLVKVNRSTRGKFFDFEMKKEKMN
jgi:hypothetical protein